MLSRILQALRLRKRPDASAERCIFTYWDGSKERSIDPIVAIQSLKADPKLNLEDHPGLANKGDDEAFEICVAASRNTFGLKPYDSDTKTGTTASEAYAVFLKFGSWMAELKKNISGEPTSPVPSELPPSAHPSTTKPASACGSTPPA
jgi:hypothetical protein